MRRFFLKRRKTSDFHRSAHRNPRLHCRCKSSSKEVACVAGVIAPLPLPRLRRPRRLQKRKLCVSVYDSIWQHYGQGTGSYFATNTRRPLKWGESSELESSIFFRLCSLFCLITCKDYGV